jgi:hypothetical protein
MPELSEISYSREVCITAVRDYYRFLTKMYLGESSIIEPPEEGWPTITADLLQDMGKTDEVLALLCHLPYIRNDFAEVFPGCHFADWQIDCQHIAQGRTTAENIKNFTEDLAFCGDIPPTVVGLTSGEPEISVFLLDTERGIIHWSECPWEIKVDPTREIVAQLCAPSLQHHQHENSNHFPRATANLSSSH